VPTFNSSTFGNYTRKWLVGTGVFEILLASVFVGIAVVSKTVRGGFYLTGGILGVVGFGLIWFGMRSGAKADEAERIAATGIAGQATIVGLTQTGVSLNDNPQVGIDLMVTIPGRQPYAAHRKEFVPLILLGRLANGGMLPVKVDPADPSKVVIGWDQLGAAPLGVAAAPGTGSETIDQVQAMAAASGLSGIGHPAAGMGGVSIAQLRQYLRDTGLSGWGTLDLVQDTGQTVGDDRVLRIAMTIHVDGKPPYKSESLSLVPQSVVSKAVLGASVPVKVAADNPDALMVEWDRV
jgi:hypothetical protein